MNAPTLYTFAAVAFAVGTVTTHPTATCVGTPDLLAALRHADGWFFNAGTPSDDVEVYIGGAVGDSTRHYATALTTTASAGAEATCRAILADIANTILGEIIPQIAAYGVGNNGGDIADILDGYTSKAADAVTLTFLHAEIKRLQGLMYIGGDLENIDPDLQAALGFLAEGLHAYGRILTSGPSWAATAYRRLIDAQKALGIDPQVSAQITAGLAAKLTAL